jgi:hypothetical protein
MIFGRSSNLLSDGTLLLYLEEDLANCRLNIGLKSELKE